MRVGVIGLGIMGFPMALNLRRAGFEVFCWTRTQSKLEVAREKGLRVCRTPEEVAENSHITALVLANEDVTRQIFERIRHHKKGGWIVDHGTNSFAWCKEALGKQDGFKFVDIPMLGSKPQAEARQLVFLAGGEKEELEELSGYLGAMGKHVVFTGGRGKGFLLKLALNFAVALVNLTLAEGAKIAEGFGVGKEKFCEALLESALASPYLGIKAKKILSDDWSEQFPIRLMAKDLRLILDHLVERRIPSSLAGVAYSIFQRAENSGLSDEDVIAVFKLLKDEISR